jgi:hypothetical protein
MVPLLLVTSASLPPLIGDFVEIVLGIFRNRVRK